MFITNKYHYALDGVTSGYTSTTQTTSSQLHTQETIKLLQIQKKTVKLLQRGLTLLYKA